jgi:hypothetical protein
MFNGFTRYSFPFEKNQIPSNGIYILFEKGEAAHSTDRIVQVGTHTGANQLYSRLKQHFVVEDKDRSILRKNIGGAMLNKDGDNYLEKWELDLTTKKVREASKKIINRERQNEIEKKVSEYIQAHFTFAVLKIDDKDIRLSMKSRIIATVSWCDECHQSDGWLGNYSPKEKIKKSGLWLVNELWKKPLDDEDIKQIGVLNG